MYLYPEGEGGLNPESRSSHVVKSRRNSLLQLAAKVSFNVSIEKAFHVTELRMHASQLSLVS